VYDSKLATWEESQRVLWNRELRLALAENSGKVEVVAAAAVLAADAVDDSGQDLKVAAISLLLIGLSAHRTHDMYLLESE
jgi:hypothetical protein